MRNYIKYFILFFATIIGFQGYAQTNEKNQLQKKKESIEKEIQNTSKLISETQKNTKNTSQQVRLIESQMYNYEQLIFKTNEEMQSLNADIENKKQNIFQLQSELSLLKNQYARMIYFAYLTRKPTSRLIYLFSANSINQAWQRMNYFKEYAIIRKAQYERILLAQQNIETLLKDLEKTRNEKKSLQNKQESNKTTLIQQKKIKDSAIKDLFKKEKNLRANLAKKRNESIVIQKQIQKIIEAEIEASRKRVKIATTAKNNKANNTSYQMTKEEVLVSNNFADNMGRMPWPVPQGSITERFGVHPHPVFADLKVKNNGIDITTAKGNFARAIYEGNVSAVIELPNGSYMVMIRHGDYISTYVNLKDVSIKKGSNVSTKQNLGTIASDDEGNSILHFEIWKEKQPQNPELWISK